MIRMNDFASEPRELREQELASVERVLHSGRFILGDEVQRFEEAWAESCGTRFAVGVANGMDAIVLGLRAMKIGPGDEVITASMTAMATVLAIMQAGATPVLADIDPETALLDPSSAERCLTAKTKAVLLVHLYGQIAQMEPWVAFCEKAGVHLLEDCAQAHGAVWNGKRAGSFGRWGAFSFYPTKNLGAKGDAGAIVTDSEEIAMRVRTLRNYGAEKRYEHPELGWNSRLDEFQAAILSTRLSWLGSFNARRKEIARQYSAAIKNPRINPLAAPPTEQSHVYHLWVIRCAERDRLAGFLTDRGVETFSHYPIPTHRQGCCKGVRCDPEGLRNADAHAQQCLSLPCHPQLRDKDVAAVITAVNQFQ